MRIAKMLKKSQNAVARDQKTFNSWHAGAIDTDEALRQFFENNAVREDQRQMITPKQFTEWLNGLGYYEPFRG